MLFTRTETFPKCATYVRKEANLKPQKHLQIKDHILSITVEAEGRKIQFINIYSPGRSFYAAEAVKDIAVLSHAFVAGDFNAHHEAWYGPQAPEYHNNIRGDRTQARKIIAWFKRAQLTLLNTPGEFTHFPRNRNRPTIVDLTLAKGLPLDRNTY